jgi:hypothetical protein
MQNQKLDREVIKQDWEKSIVEAKVRIALYCPLKRRRRRRRMMYVVATQEKVTAATMYHHYLIVTLY